MESHIRGKVTYEGMREMGEKEEIDRKPGTKKARGKKTTDIILG